MITVFLFMNIVFMSSCLCPLTGLPFMSYNKTTGGGGGGGGALPKKLVTGVRPASQTLTLFTTKLCYFPYPPIYDLTKNLIPYL